jgi:hypothetical protein
MGQSTRIRETVSVNVEPSVGFDGGVQAAVSPIDIFWPDGTTARSADRYGVESGTLAAEGTATLDLTAWNGPRGVDVGIADVRALLIELSAPCTLAPGASNGWVGLGAAWTVTLQAGKYRFICGSDPSMPVSGTNKTILLTAGAGAAVDYQITAIGTSA